MTNLVLGKGTISLDWTAVEGRPGFAPRLALVGELTASGHEPGTAVQLIADVTVDVPAGPGAFLGTTSPSTYRLHPGMPETVQPFPYPPGPPKQRVELHLQLHPTTIEALEEARQGKEFHLVIDGRAVLIGAAASPTPPDLQLHQGQLRVPLHVWGEVLERWGRGVGFTCVVPLAHANASGERKRVVEYLRKADQRIDAGDYEAAGVDARQAIDQLRKMLECWKGTEPPNRQQRTMPQRIYATLQALHDEASVYAHGSEPHLEFVPTRADAVALAVGAAAKAQQVFTWLDLDGPLNPAAAGTQGETPAR
jgi:hypothetical protein